MFPYLSFAMALVAAAINLGLVQLPTGHWPGISLGMAAALLGAMELRGPRAEPARDRAGRALAWMGVGIGLVAALLGVAVYLGWILAAARLA